MAAVVIGVDPRKLSATIEVLNEQEKVLGGGGFGTDRDGYRQLLAAGGQGPAYPHAGSVEVASDVERGGHRPERTWPGWRGRPASPVPSAHAVSRMTART